MYKYLKTHKRFILQSLSLLLFSSNSLAIAANKLLENSRKIIETEYSSFKLVNYIHKDKISGGGALTTINGNYIIYATVNGHFNRINPKTLAIKYDYLPSINFGRLAMAKSSFYSYRESLPRIHDILYFKENYYISYDRYVIENDRVHFEISKLDESNNVWKTIYRAPDIDVHYFTFGNGGKMTGYRGNYILFSLGDYSLDRKNNLDSDFAPQNSSLPWGKINLLDIKSKKVIVFSKGHRNPQGLTILTDGQIIASEHGPRGGDEINLIKRNNNYGWPFTSLGTRYNSYARISYSSIEIINKIRQLNFTDPIYSFIPSIAPTDIIQIKNIQTSWKGNLLLASLKARSLFNIKLKTIKTSFFSPNNKGVLYQTSTVLRKNHLVFGRFANA
jgi:hypothetical protein